ncbi:P1 family peptidase [Pseudomonas putida]|jgi:L-aminopeptidase/D-esterase-like protein|uniref:P1 family peptidase n=1 Tax=Pseudomonas putida TaxID=303 RepID=A0ABD7BJ55_PSEPU|nr:hypothetical protein O162_26315 [Pseudomonas putida SJ3]MBH3452932.1 P1 family peptidase [Pseudomonas putida]PNA86273.1 hypothetical protein C1X74_30100 [Pseudomonas sp. GW460-5]PNB53438.1 hypothetical protein C1X73_31230 [Pseudomonas sp. FW305-130]MDO1498786.1 hypothetical protein [Pseudomonas putida]
MRARDFGITLGLGRPGPHNAITDVPGVRVGHATLSKHHNGKPVRTGVSVIEPREGPARHQPCFANISPLFAAAADAVEEAIVNAILAGRTLQTEDGREVPGLEGSRLLKALEQVGWKAQG